jgi:hypothetical protein
MLAHKYNIAPATLGDLLRRLADGGDCHVEGVQGMSGPRGHARCRRVVRDGQDVKRFAVLPNIDDGDTLSIHVGRSICVRLGFDPAVFGY